MTSILKNHKLFLCKYIFLSGIVLCISSCKTYIPKGDISEESTKDLIDYSNLNFWAAHLDKTDPSDQMPDGKSMSYENADVAVFFVHPTTYTGTKKHETEWNAPISHPDLDKKTDESTILFQASAFNQVGPVYAPRYRQAHLQVYFDNNQKITQKALDIAYQDVKNAFSYFINKLHVDKPFIIAAHSQGTTHAIRLINELIDNKPLKEKMITAYLIGMPVKRNEFTEIIPCENPNDIHCFVSWRTYKRGFIMPEQYKKSNILVTNPISWTTTNEYVSNKNNKGTLLYKFNKVYQTHIDAQVNDEVLWSNKPKFFGSFLLRTNNYHVADINFYYFDIQQNTLDRVKAWKSKIIE